MSDGVSYVENSVPKWWVFGHIHQPLSCTIGSIYIIANLLGYKHKNTLTAKLASFSDKTKEVTYNEC